MALLRVMYENDIDAFVHSKHGRERALQPRGRRLQRA
jgi:hypothetical protein